MVHCIIFNSKNGIGHKKYISAHWRLRHIGVHTSNNNLGAYKLYNKNTNVYQLYNGTDDIIVKNIVFLNHNICTGALNNLNALMLYIHNLHWYFTNTICIGALSTIYTLVLYITYMPKCIY